jgi:hypothetical protein
MFIPLVAPLASLGLASSVGVGLARSSGGESRFVNRRSFDTLGNESIGLCCDFTARGRSSFFKITDCRSPKGGEAL